MAQTQKTNVSKLNDVEEEESFSYAMQMAMSSIASMALQTTFELGVFDIIAKAGEGAKLSANDIAHQLPTQSPEAPKMLDRMLGLLAAHSLLHCSSCVDDEEGRSSKHHRLYSLSPASKFFARDADAISLGPLMNVFHHKVVLEAWSPLKDAILEGGIAFERAQGMHLFEYLGLDSQFNQIYNTALIHHTSMIMRKVVECYKGFEELNTLVDVGGNLGLSLSFITSKYPHIRAINFDLPHVIQHAHPYPRVEHVAGDMFESVPKGDAIFMKWILHNWSDEKCVKLLKNCHEATPKDGKVIVVESGILATPETTASAKCNFGMDVFMMAQDPGGKERTEQDFMDLAQAAGFRGVRYECFVRNFWVLEFFK